jgi:hypothetical protein
MVSGWEILEEQSYERAVAQIANHEFFDSALAPILYALNRDPTGFPVVPGIDVRLAKTKLRFVGAEIIPSYRLWFKIDHAKRRVHLLWVEISPPEDMGVWNEEDEIPF